MQNIPLESSFLANKFTGLSEAADIHMMVWDSRDRAEQFIKENKLASSVIQKIHRSVSGNSSLLHIFVSLTYLFLQNRKLRSFLLNGKGKFTKRLKVAAYYLPVFKIQPAIIHFEFGTLAKDIALLKQFTDAKIIVSFRGYDINYVALHQSGYYDEVWNHVDGLHFLGMDLKQRAIGRGYKDNLPEAIIPPAIDTMLFQPSGTARPLDKLIIISVGRLVWKKGYEYGIRAAALLKKKNIPFEYHIAGDGQHLQAIQFTISELGLQNEVILHGNIPRNAVKTQLDKAHIFLHPAISEGFCNAVIEAQAMALPVVCTDADGLPENIADGKTGFIVPKWDIDAMADRMEWFWNHPEQLKIFGQAGVERVNTHFKIQEQTGKFLQFYNQVYGSGKQD